MSLPCCQVVHVRLEVLDDATLVCRCQIRTRVREAHGANSIVVGLQDSLEIEGKAIPQREFAACRTREDASTFWCPLECTLLI